MISVNNNGSLELERLSNIELYYSEPEMFSDKLLTICGDELHHITKVMRHKVGDEIYITNGQGKIFYAKLNSISKIEARAEINKEYSYQNKFKNIVFCIPKLKSPDRFEFALEKSVELGVTNFIVYNSKRSVKKGDKTDRWKKIALSAMKQSLRSFLPEIKEYNTLKEIMNLKGEIIFFEQNSEQNIKRLKILPEKDYYFVFGPEGGLDEEELNLINPKQIYSLVENRLRSETAVINTAAILVTLL